MIMDQNLAMCLGVSVAKEAGPNLLGNVIDTGLARDIGQSARQLYLVILVTTAFDGGAGTNGTTQFVLASDSVEAIAADGNESRHWTSDVFLAATQLTKGTKIVVPFPSGNTGPGDGYERFIGIEAIQAVEGEDDGVIDAFLTFDPPTTTRTYPDASN